ncbi:uncharacterized protein V1516DRAFT_670160 [Lipomyces oligophaga]|uniref:uncharacterized protein n=1 Tax=Lipomyces oligophaga TaxID=45792 RepID=UPI0034CEA863
MPALIDSSGPPDPKFETLLTEFLRHVPSTPSGQTDKSDALHPTLSVPFLSQLSPLLRARMSYNIHQYSLDDSSLLDNDSEEDRYRAQRVLDSLHHQWANMLSWSSTMGSPEDPELGPILARKIYQARDDLVLKFSEEEQERHFESLTNAIKDNGVLNPDIETTLANVTLPEYDLALTWSWISEESAWRVYEAKIISENDVNLNHITTRSDDDDDEYWDQYDSVPDESKDQIHQTEQTDLSPEDDEKFYAKYDSVESVIGDKAESIPSTTEIGSANSPIQYHLQSTLHSLYQLSLSSGISKDQFLYLAKEATNDSLDITSS